MKKGKKSRGNLLFVFALFIIAVIAIAVFTDSDKNEIFEQKTQAVQSGKSYSKAEAEKKISKFAQNNGLDISDYPESLVDLLARNSETEDFVLSYPLEKDEKHKINLKEYKNCTEVPLFMQWDKRWGYIKYGDDVAGLTGCGPVCLSMVAVYVKQDIKYSPDYMLEFAKDNHYCIKGGGSEWTLISKGGKKLGMDVIEIPLDENRIVKNLEAGNPIICVMGPGDFTTKGHFIVMTGYKNGKIKINDPNSYANSKKLWNYDDIYKQIKNLWVIR